jgi:hypothetical protein
MARFKVEQKDRLQAKGYLIAWIAGHDNQRDICEGGDVENSVNNIL